MQYEVSCWSCAAACPLHTVHASIDLKINNDINYLFVQKKKKKKNFLRGDTMSQTGSQNRSSALDAWMWRV